MLICIQNINFITQFFLKILQRNSKFVNLGKLGIPGYAHPKRHYQLAETFLFTCRQKINFIPTFFCKLVILRTQLRCLSACQK